MGIVGKSTINLPSGSGDLSLYILQLTNIQSLLSKCRRFIVGAVGGDLYFAYVSANSRLPRPQPVYVVVGLYIDRCIIKTA